MSDHIICLTIDTDPDGLSGLLTNRDAISFTAQERLFADRFAEQLTYLLKREIPITWFVRIDKQIQRECGSATYLLERFDHEWKSISLKDHEIGWHPHLYYYDDTAGEYKLQVDIDSAADEIEELHGILCSTGFRLKSFRNGEAWHHPQLYDLVERLGYGYDSTVIPGRTSCNILKDWTGAPSSCYFPDKADLKNVGPERKLLEMPMSSWLTQASYDQAPKLRYMNPCVRKEIFNKAVADNASALLSSKSDVVVWNFISHPDDMINLSGRDDLLYHHSINSYAENINSFREFLEAHNCQVSYDTISGAGKKWIAAC